MMFHKINKFFIYLFVVLTWSFTLNAASLPDGFPKCFNSDVRTSDFCPISAKLGHKIFLVDFTSRWEQPQIDWVKGRIFGDALIADTPPYHKISYLKIDNTPPHSQEFIYSKCRFKKGTESPKYAGEKVNKKCEGIDTVKSIFASWQQQINLTEKDFFPKNEEANQSLIYEYIIHILRKKNFITGYSDHSNGIIPSISAMAKGASIIEKHFTDSKERSGPDIVCSMDAKELIFLNTVNRRLCCLNQKKSKKQISVDHLKL